MNWDDQRDLYLEYTPDGIVMWENIELEGDILSDDIDDEYEEKPLLDVSFKEAIWLMKEIEKFLDNFEYWEWGL